MQHLPWRSVIGLRPQANILTPAVHFISSQRKSEVLKVHANLVGSAGVQNDLNESCGPQSLQNTVTGPGLPPFACFCHGHGSAMRWVPGDGCLDFT